VVRVAGGAVRWVAMHDGSALRVQTGGPAEQDHVATGAVEGAAGHVARLSSPGTLVLECPVIETWHGYVGLSDGAAGEVLLRAPRRPPSVTLTAPAATWRYDEHAGAVQLVLPAAAGTRFTISW